MKRSSLPIDAHLAELLGHLRQSNRLVLEAPPGTGKTTRVPLALMESGLLRDLDPSRQEIWVLQPRRMAARMVARHVAMLAGERVGERVGYQVRYDEVSGPRTCLRFMTEGMLHRRMMGNPSLKGVGAVIFDEFHERHIDGDLGLALALRTQAKATGLRLIVMSATLQGDRLGQWLGNAPVMRVGAPVFPVDMAHDERVDDRPLATRVRVALRRVLDAEAKSAPNGDATSPTGLPAGGDVLVFLPGMGEIRRASTACAGLAKSYDCVLLPLHGSLSTEQQERAIGPSAKRKIILSTNVAETSLTIDGVTTVVDSGLARVPGTVTRGGALGASGLQTLQIGDVSKASAIQRAGRAGRTRPGQCIRLYTRRSFEQRVSYDEPEVVRSDLAPMLLRIAVAGHTASDLQWLDPPPELAVTTGQQLLERLGAVVDGEITKIGRAIARYPVHPRHGRLLVEGAALGVGQDAAVIVAILGERDLRADHDHRRAATEHGTSDLLVLRDLYIDAKKARFDSHRLRSLGVHAIGARAVQQAVRQLTGVDKSLKENTLKGDAADTALLRAILTAYPDRVAQVRKGRGERVGNRNLAMANGGRAAVAASSVVHDMEWVTVVDAESRGRGGGLAITARLISGIECDWLLDTCADSLVESSELVWSSEASRVEVDESIRLGSLTLVESREVAKATEASAVVLREAIERMPLGDFVDPEKLAALRVRMSLLESIEQVEPLSDDVVRRAVFEASDGVSIKPGSQQAVWSLLMAQLGPGVAEKLRRLVPDEVVLPGGRRLRVNYQSDRGPWVESRLQDFFGSTAGPCIGDGRVKLTLHLLAPNRRAVQVTDDLAGFWVNHYPGIRKTLSRRYPRHPWPDDPAATAPPPTGGQRRKVRTRK